MEENNVNEENLPVGIGADNLIRMAELAEKRVDAINRIKRAALKVTNARDWTNQNDNPYLNVSGGEKVARLFGISWRIDEPQLMVREDGHFGYTYKGYFSLGTATIEFEGSRSSLDGFFTHGGKIPPTEIDKNDVKKAALTNTIGNGVTRILGIRNLSWEDLKESGIDISKIVKIDYGKAEMTEEVKDLRKKIGKMLMEMAGNDKAEASKLLLLYTTFVDKKGKTVKGKSTLADISEKAMPVTYGKVTKVYEEWKKGEKEEEKDIEKKFEENEKKIKKGEDRDEPGEGKLL